MISRGTTCSYFVLRNRDDFRIVLVETGGQNHDLWRSGRRGKGSSRNIARGGRKILLAACFVSDYASRNGTAGVEFVEHGTALGIECQQIAIQVAREHYAAGCRCDAGYDRRVGVIFPKRFAAIAIDGSNPAAPRALTGDGRLTGTKVELAFNVFWIAGDDQLAEIDGTDIDNA